MCSRTCPERYMQWLSLLFFTVEMCTELFALNDVQSQCCLISHSRKLEAFCSAKILGTAAGGVDHRFSIRNFLPDSEDLLVAGIIGLVCESDRKDGEKAS